MNMAPKTEFHNLTTIAFDAPNDSVQQPENPNHLMYPFGEHSFSCPESPFIDLLQSNS